MKIEGAVAGIVADPEIAQTVQLEKVRAAALERERQVQTRGIHAACRDHRGSAAGDGVAPDLVIDGHVDPIDAVRSQAHMTVSGESILDDLRIAPALARWTDRIANNRQAIAAP